MKKILCGLLLLSAVITGCSKSNSSSQAEEPEAKPIAGFDVNECSDGWVLEGSDVLVTNTSVNAYSSHWDFGNGITSDQRTPSGIKYSPCGAFSITLTVSNGVGGTATYSKTVNVQCSGKHAPPGAE